MTDTSHKSQPEDKTETAPVQEKDTKALVVGVVMLLAAGVIGYSLGFRSGQGSFSTASPTTLADNAATQPTIAAAGQSDEDVVVVQSIPSDWQTYDRLFGVATFTFQYPPGYVVSDTDVQNGQIYIFQENDFSFPAPIVIDSLNRTFYFQEYQSGSVEDWFIDNIQIVYPDTDFSQLAVEETKLQGGKTYLKISNWPEAMEQINTNLFTGTWYIHADPAVSYYLVDNGRMNEETIERILSTLQVSLP
jgi:hypothetical protein